jgi:hypothetical protein
MAFIDVPPDLPVVAVIQSEQPGHASPERRPTGAPANQFQENPLISQAASDLANDFVVSTPIDPRSGSGGAPLGEGHRPATSQTPTANQAPAVAAHPTKKTALKTDATDRVHVEQGAEPPQDISESPGIPPDDSDLNLETEPEATGADIESPEVDSSETMRDAAAGSIPGPALNITADYQDYDPLRQVVTARGNVLLRLNDAILAAEKLWVNLLNRYAFAEGNVLLTRGEQVIRGQQAEYSFTQGAGVILEAQGELFLPALETDFSSPVASPTTSRSVYDPLNPDQPLRGVSGAGGLEISSSSNSNFSNAQGGIRRLRFEADRVNIDADIWEAEGVRITNDPFSPPELEFRSDRVTLVSLSAEQDLLTAQRPRLVFDQGFALPLVRSQFILNRGVLNPDDLNPLPTGIGIDGRDRGGLFLERRLTLMQTPNVNIGLTPQYLLTRAFNQGLFAPDALGLSLDASARLGPRTTLSAGLELSSVSLDNVSENLRANVRGQQLLGNHTLALEYSYRDRLYNGSLGFQDVRSTVGAVLLSPPIQLTRGGLGLTYQIGAQYITSETDRADLLGPNPPDNLISLGRFQGSARLVQGFTLWRGQALPATPTEGLRYSPFPLVPQVTLGAGLQGTFTYYTSGDAQEILAGEVSLNAELGHLSRNILDYTRLNLGYYKAFVGGDDSPFTFDRAVDQNVLSFGLMQQIYGPFLLGFQTSLNLDTGKRVNSEIIAEYSRRTYGIVIRYSPTQSTGAIGFRLSNFNWLGNSDPFDNPRFRTVEGGVINQ